MKISGGHMNTKKYLYIILNDTSGSGEAKNISAILASLENRFDFHATIRRTKYAKHALLLAEELAEEAKNCPGQPILVAMGGDGTLSETVAGLKQNYSDLPVAFVPYGSGNDFARSSGLPLKPLDAILRLLVTEEPVEKDVLVYQDLLRSQTHYAVNSVGFGLDGTVIHEKNQTGSKKKNRRFQFSKFAYIATLFAAYKNQDGFSVTLRTNDSEKEFKNTILALNVNLPFAGGGMKLVPSASADDGMIDFVIVEKLSFKELVKVITYVLEGKGKHLSLPKLHAFQLAEYEFSISSDQYGQADGEELDAGPQSYHFSTFKRLFWI